MLYARKPLFRLPTFPAVRRVIDTLATLGIDDHIIVVVGQGEPSVRAAFRGCATDVIYVRQPQPLGTAEAVLHATPYLDDDFLVVAGDVVTAEQNLSALIASFNSERPVGSRLDPAIGQRISPGLARRISRSKRRWNPDTIYAPWKAILVVAANIAWVASMLFAPQP